MDYELQSKIERVFELFSRNLNPTSARGVVIAVIRLVTCVIPLTLRVPHRGGDYHVPGVDLALPRLFRGKPKGQFIKRLWANTDV